MFVFFDLDRTLMDFDTAETCGIKALYENYPQDIQMDYETFKTTFKRVAQEFFDQYSAGILSFDQQRRARVSEIFRLNGTQLDAHEAEKRFWFYWENYEKNYLPFKDTKIVLEKLKKQGIPMGIITNGDRNNQLKKLSFAGITEYFDPIIISSDVGISKPDTKIFEIAIEKAGSSISETWYVGDSIIHDIEPSRKLGLNTIYYNVKKENESPLIHYEDEGNIYAEVKDFKSIPGIIMKKA